MIVQSKVCTKCGEDKPFSEYYKHKEGKYGLRSSCKQCIADYGKKYYESNKEECLKRGREWAKRNPTKISAIQERYKEKNPERYANRWIKRRTIKRKLKYDFSPIISKRIRRITQNKCAITGDDDTHLDHFIPMSTGHGGTYEGNLILLSKELNLSKGTRNPFIWAKDYLTEEQQKNFTKVVEYLAELNGLTVEEYREFVFWCFENPRDVDEITEDNRDSLSIWLRENAVA